MTTVYIGIAALLAVLFLAWRVIAAYNAPKTEAEKTKQAEIAKQKKKEQLEARDERRDDNAAKRQGRWWRRGRRRGGEPVPTPAPAVPPLEPSVKS